MDTTIFYGFPERKERKRVANAINGDSEESNDSTDDDEEICQNEIDEFYGRLGTLLK